jgi:flavin-dependent dehydrogenase
MSAHTGPGVDLLIVGGGPAGAIAGLVAARAGARVRIVERAAFPRDKLCGDTINPGALSDLRRLGVAGAIEARGLPVAGMVVTGEGGVRIEGTYPRGLLGRALVRRDLDAILLEAAAAAGCAVDHEVAVRRATVGDRRGVRVLDRVVVATRGGERALAAPVVIAADGRRSALAFGLGLVRHPPRPRRWAIGAYFEALRCRTRVRPVSDPCPTRVGHVSDPGPTPVMGEMHVRRNCYIGVAEVPGSVTNVCLVRASGGGDADFRDPAAILTRHLAADSQLRDRFATARLAAPPSVLGPLAVEPSGEAIDGLLLAGDAAGFIDPMTGDGLRFAIRGGELAAHAALEALADGWSGVHARLATTRAQSFAGKWRFNRALRALVASPPAVDAAAVAARFAPAVLQAVVARAGDCHVAG